MFQMVIRAIEHITTTKKFLHKFSFIWQNGFSNKPEVILLNQLFASGSVNIWVVNISLSLRRITVNCYIRRLSLNKTKIVIGWFLVMCTWSNSNVSQQLLPACQIQQHVISAWLHQKWYDVHVITAARLTGADLTTLPVFSFNQRWSKMKSSEVKRKRFCRLFEEKILKIREKWLRI